MHLYVHVPFCRRRCSYCDFAIAVRKQVPGDEFTETIKQEWVVRACEIPAGLETLYFGGGGQSGSGRPRGDRLALVPIPVGPSAA